MTFQGEPGLRRGTASPSCLDPALPPSCPLPMSPASHPHPVFPALSRLESRGPLPDVTCPPTSVLSRAGRLSVYAASGPWRPSPHLGHLLCPGGRRSDRCACATQRGVVRHRCFSEDLGGEGAPSEAASFLVFIFLRWERGEPGDRGSLRDESGREPEGTGGVTPGDGERPLPLRERKPQSGLRRSFRGFSRQAPEWVGQSRVGPEEAGGGAESGRGLESGSSPESGSGLGVGERSGSVGCSRRQSGSRLYFMQRRVGRGGLGTVPGQRERCPWARARERQVHLPRGGG